MEALFLTELTLGFIVLCADSLAEDSPRRPSQRLLRSVFWMVTLSRWFTHRNIAKLARFGAIVWFLVTTGWLLTLVYDRTETTTVFLVLAEVMMGFVVYCVDAMSADLHNRPFRRVLRSIFWMKPVTDYMRDDDTLKIAHASLTVWILLTTGWLLTLQLDRLARPLGMAGP